MASSTGNEAAAFTQVVSRLLNNGSPSSAETAQTRQDLESLQSLLTATNQDGGLSGYADAPVPMTLAQRLELAQRVDMLCQSLSSSTAAAAAAAAADGDGDDAAATASGAHEASSRSPSSLMHHIGGVDARSLLLPSNNQPPSAVQRQSVARLLAVREDAATTNTFLATLFSAQTLIKTKSPNPRRTSALTGRRHRRSPSPTLQRRTATRTEGRQAPTVDSEVDTNSEDENGMSIDSLDSEYAALFADMHHAFLSDGHERDDEEEISDDGQDYEDSAQDASEPARNGADQAAAPHRFTLLQNFYSAIRRNHPSPSTSTSTSTGTSTGTQFPPTTRDRPASMARRRLPAAPANANGWPVDNTTPAELDLDALNSALDWCSVLIAGGASSDDFWTRLAADKHATAATSCFFLWDADYVAYRCKTCGLSPCTSICAACFEKGNHVGHDYSMFRSFTGGACDCGDSGVMKASGFCADHCVSDPETRRQKEEREAALLPSWLSPYSQFSCRRVLTWLVRHALHLYLYAQTAPHATASRRSPRSAALVSDTSASRTLGLVDASARAAMVADEILAACFKWMSTSSDLRVVMSHILLEEIALSEDIPLVAEMLFQANPQNALPSWPVSSDDSVTHTSATGHSSLPGSTPQPQSTTSVARASAASATYCPTIAGIPIYPPGGPSAWGQSLDAHRVPSNASAAPSHTLLYWLMAASAFVGLPQTFVTFALYVLPFQRVKDEAAHAFSCHYLRLTTAMPQSHDPARYCNRVVHISCQLFSNPGLALQSEERDNCSAKLATSLCHVLGSNVKHAPLAGRADLGVNQDVVVNINAPFIKKHQYWSVTSDLVNILTHPQVACMMLGKAPTLWSLAQIVSLIQGIFYNTRCTTVHIEYEPDEYSTAFELEIEASGTFLGYFRAALETLLPPAAQLAGTQSRLVNAAASAAPALNKARSQPRTVRELLLPGLEPASLRESLCAERLEHVLPALSALAQMLVDWHSRAGMTRREVPHNRSAGPVFDFAVDVRPITLHIPLHRWFAVFASRGMAWTGLTWPILWSKIHKFAQDFERDRQQSEMTAWLEESRAAMKLESSSASAASLVSAPRRASSRGFYSDVLLQHQSLPAMESFIAAFFEFPLRVYVLRAQARAGMWRRNGESLAQQVWMYMHPSFAETFVDPDIFALQLGAIALSPNTLLTSMAMRFGLASELSFSAPEFRVGDTPDLFADFFSLLITMLSERTFLGMSFGEYVRMEIIHRLAVDDFTHSSLTESLPHRVGADEQFDEILKQVADYHAPANTAFSMRQGFYSLRRECWDEVDLAHLVARIYSKSTIAKGIQRMAFARPDLVSATATAGLLTPAESASGSGELSTSPGHTGGTAAARSSNASVWATRFPYRRLQPLSNEFAGLLRMLDDPLLHALVFFAAYRLIYAIECDRRVRDRAADAAGPSTTACEASFFEAMHVLRCALDFHDTRYGVGVGPSRAIWTAAAAVRPHRVASSVFDLGLPSSDIVVNMCFECVVPPRISVGGSFTASSGTPLMNASILSLLNALCTMPEMESHASYLSAVMDRIVAWSGCRAYCLALRSGTSDSPFEHAVRAVVEDAAASSLHSACAQSPPKNGADLTDYMQHAAAEQAESDAASSAKRKQAASQRKLAIMNEFSARQRAFVQHTQAEESRATAAVSTEVGETEDSVSSTPMSVDGSDANNASAPVYECVICLTSTPSTLAEPMGYVAWVFPSGVLDNEVDQAVDQAVHQAVGAGANEHESATTPTPPALDSHATVASTDPVAIRLFRQANRQKKSVDALAAEHQPDRHPLHMLQHVDIQTTKGDQAVSLQVRSCGHCMHFECYSQFICNTFHTPSVSAYIDTSHGMYSCTTCRRVANVLLPILPVSAVCSSDVAAVGLGVDSEQPEAADAADAAWTESALSPEVLDDDATAANVNGVSEMRAVVAATSIIRQVTQASRLGGRFEDCSFATVASTMRNIIRSALLQASSVSQDAARRRELLDKMTGYGELVRMLFGCCRNQPDNNDNIDNDSNDNNKGTTLMEHDMRHSLLPLIWKALVCQPSQQSPSDLSSSRTPTPPSKMHSPPSPGFAHLSTLAHELLRADPPFIARNPLGCDALSVLCHLLCLWPRAITLAEIGRLGRTVFPLSIVQALIPALLHVGQQFALSTDAVAQVVDDALAATTFETLDDPSDRIDTWLLQFAKTICRVLATQSALVSGLSLDLAVVMLDKSVDIFGMPEADLPPVTASPSMESVANPDQDVGLDAGDAVRVRERVIAHLLAVTRRLLQPYVHGVHLLGNYLAGQPLAREHLFSDALFDALALVSPSLESIAHPALRCYPARLADPDVDVREVLPAAFGEQTEQWLALLSAALPTPGERQATTPTMHIGIVPSRPVQLIPLPNCFDDLFRSFRGMTCGNCHSVPAQGALCLICGTFLCVPMRSSALNCCTVARTSEIVAHSRSCCAGLAVILILSSSAVQIYRSQVTCSWGSPYLDVFGEEDIDLRRGRPLFLNQARYAALNSHFLLQSFDNSSANWSYQPHER
ncbi:ubiquitin ligase E3 [Capsaspora owczarzaki ATCC 30864]|uniref:E3 ubiquitin-protein ligase n=1 Tax=Capsaspora owczarzaki (strain ATCC 30864) TaxID=595528 RepID=A0A0D2WM36_CAPO3|nr:ubiquitin ligase E3 [Capsaspora owczarzaki ATCC 30864]KJE91113.1 ubiquitin ligase E3 [Capsaspora owczarzaki ATCC 30864]|eukprot:XP_004349049.2 ubiquitin ligase E3 [Capsaspora owczarzaki ATCC 30864]